MPFLPTTASSCSHHGCMPTWWSRAKVVDLEPGHFAVLPAADHRLGNLVRIHAELGPGVVRPGAQLPSQIGHEYQLAGLPPGWPVSSA
jgi:hypothetical protein